MFFIVIYVDILFVVNFFITLLLLLLTARLTKREVKTLRLVFSSVFGGAYSMIILADIPFYLSVISKLTSALIIVFIAFGFKRLKRFAAACLIFLFSSFVFLGIISGIYLIFRSPLIAVNNGAVYFDISARGLLLCAFISYLLSCIVIRLYNRKLEKGEVCPMKIINGGKTVSLTALTDTGNKLREPFSDSPVIVADGEKVKSVFSEKTLRLIPASTVSSSTYLMAFKPDKIIIKTKNGEREIENAYVALSTEMKDSPCSAVINPEILCL